MRPNLIACFFITMFISSCKDPVKDSKESNIEIIYNKEGIPIQVNEFVALTYTAKTEEGVIVENSSEYDDRPMFGFREPSFFKGDFFAILGELSEGDSAVFKINADSIKIKMGLPVPDTKGKYILYNVRVNKVIPRNDMTGIEYQKVINNYKLKIEEQAKTNESLKIIHYIKKQHLKPLATTSGIYYIINKEGNGPLPTLNSEITANYTISTFSGKVIETTKPTIAMQYGIYDKNILYEPMKVINTPKDNRTGFNEAISLFAKGTNATLIVPSRFAYGEKTYKGVPPFTPLICKLEIVNVVNK